MAEFAIDEQKEELSALQAIFEENIFIIRNEDSAALSYKVTVPVHLPNNSIEVEIWLPNDVDRTAAKSAAAAYKSVDARPDFTRSTSGRRWHSKFTVSNLTPIEIQLTMPDTYPADCPPSVLLSCKWLSPLHLSTVCKQLDRLWQECLGMPVVFTWIDWLQHQVLSFLGVTSSVLIGRRSTHEDASIDDRVHSGVTHCMEDVMINMLRYDCQCERQRFLQNTHECGVCMEEKSGEEFYRLSACLHHFCYDCFFCYCELHVTAGTVQLLTCPDQKCETPLPPALLRQVLGEDEYQRWERLLLQKTLDGLDDIDWCVRCQMPATKETTKGASNVESCFAHCTYCFYSYCTKCSDPWHAGRDCKSAEEKLQDLEDKINDSEKGETREQLYLKRLKLAQEIKSQEELKKISRRCPGCDIPIQKNMGCNHMRCTQCRLEFCWQCGRSIHGYDHYSASSCTVFPQLNDQGEYIVPVMNRRIRREELPGAIIVREALRNPENLSRIKHCPTCGQRNLKEGANNHLSCWSCRSHFCFQCLKRIQGKVMDHFKLPSQCKQHSA